MGNKKGSKKIVLITGIRPNIVKAFSLYKNLLNEECFEPILIHTNQHDGNEMFKLLWKEFGLPKPILLQYKYYDEADRIGRIIIELRKTLHKLKPDLVIVFGDGDSTLAGALTASKMKIPLAHVEAGLRSFDWTMPEEHNRVVTDHLSDYLFTTEYSGDQNLTFEGAKQEKIFFVGNTMIDTLMILKDKIENRVTALEDKSYILLTLHRPSNVNDKEQFKRIITFLEKIKEYPIYFPVHPRTMKSLKQLGLYNKLPKNVISTPPLGYLDFLALEKHAYAVLTDSGGVQEETTYLGVPCLTLRHNTERPSTVDIGSNSLILSELEVIGSDGYLNLFRRSVAKESRIPKYWDGQAGQRIVEVLGEKL